MRVEFIALLMALADGVRAGKFGVVGQDNTYRGMYHPEEKPSNWTSQDPQPGSIRFAFAVRYETGAPVSDVPFKSWANGFEFDRFARGGEPIESAVWKHAAVLLAFKKTVEPRSGPVVGPADAVEAMADRGRWVYAWEGPLHVNARVVQELLILCAGANRTPPKTCRQLAFACQAVRAIL